MILLTPQVESINIFNIVQRLGNMFRRLGVRRLACALVPGSLLPGSRIANSVTSKLVPPKRQQAAAVQKGLTNL